MTKVSHPEHIREMAYLGDPNAQAVVMVSTVPLKTQLARLEESLPQVRELVEATCPDDPAYDDRTDMLLSTVTAIVWLREALR